MELGKGISGSVLQNPDCIPGSTYFSPLTDEATPDIKNDRSLSVLYFFPKQLTPHRSVLLPGVKKPLRVLQAQDLEQARNGGRGRGRGRGNFNQYGDRSKDPFHARNQWANRGQDRGSDRNYDGATVWRWIWRRRRRRRTGRRRRRPRLRHIWRRWLWQSGSSWVSARWRTKRRAATAILQRRI
ncbi:hypothetical protein BDZ89DRAFT_938615 [Hymenopellis radicata]|nr:hypothetical protein BDZ89DRAFT_938615 [Hymenopellis radicata]